MQRKCGCGKKTVGKGQCAECSKAEQQQNRPRTVEQVAQQINATSQPLDDKTVSVMGDKFGVDFSNVRIHTDSVAQAAADVLRADAFTIGSHIFFAHNRYNPDTREGKFLLAHELAHVVQQNDSQLNLGNSELSSGATASLESSADTIAQQVVDSSNTGHSLVNNNRASRNRVALTGAPLGILLKRRPGQGILDCINECTSNAGFPATMGGILAGVCGVIAVLVAAAATPESAGSATIPAGVAAAAFCAGFALGVPTGIMAACMWECRS